MSTQTVVERCPFTDNAAEDGRGVIQSGGADLGLMLAAWSE
ncbi:MAG: hypothetical protein ACYTDE_09540 [Planctomycetota bacterium]